MITRQSCFDGLFKLKKSGVDISEQLKIMRSRPGVPREVVEFLQDKSPQFQFYRDIHKNQRALMKNLLNYESLDLVGKIKVGSSLITRAMISVEYKNLDESLVEDLCLDKLSKAISKALSERDSNLLDESLNSHREAIRFFYRKERKDKED